MVEGIFWIVGVVCHGEGHQEGRCPILISWPLHDRRALDVELAAQHISPIVITGNRLLFSRPGRRRRTRRRIRSGLRTTRTQRNKSHATNQRSNNQPHQTTNNHTSRGPTPTRTRPTRTSNRNPLTTRDTHTPRITRTRTTRTRPTRTTIRITHHNSLHPVQIIN